MNFELDSELIDKINDLIGLDRNLLSNKESSNELISKLKNKINTLKDNFIANLPYKYTDDETEFLKFCSKIQNLKVKLDSVKSDESSVTKQIKQYKLDCQNSNRNYEAELKPIVLKAISIKRQLYYIKSLVKLEEYKTKIESYLEQFKQLNEKKTKLKSQSASTSGQDIYLTIKNVTNELNSLIENIISIYLEFIEYSNRLSQTKCENLKIYLHQLVNYLHERIRSIFISEFETDLKNLAYPLNTSYTSPTEVALAQKKQEKTNSDSGINQNTNVILNKEKLEDLLKKSAKRLLIIEQPSMFIKRDTGKNIIIDLLIQPLEKRFKFHFFTNRKTNNLDKPEWFLTQILQWIKDQNDFINRNIQPVFDEIDFLKGKSAIILFSNGLVSLIKEKLDFDLNNLIKNQIQFSNTIDQLILFNSQLTTYLNCSCNSFENYFKFYTCLHVICENTLLFSHWLNLEKQVCQKKLDLMFSSLSLNNSSIDDVQTNKSSSNLSLLNNNEKLLNEIWSCNYSDVDVMKPPHCAESFILMIKAITDRYANLPFPSKKLRFVYLQLELINDFHLRLCQIIRDEAKVPFSKSYLGVLNTVNYIIYILDEWKNSAFFIEMQFYKLKYVQFLKKIEMANSNNTDVPNTGTDKNIIHHSSNQNDFLITEFNEEICKLFDQNTITSENKKYNQISSFCEMEGTLFDDIMPSYEKIKDDMVNTITSNCKWQLTSRSKLYKKEKWMTMPLFSEYYKPTLTQSAADMLISLRNILHLLKDSIAKTVFESILKKLTVELDKFFYEDLILGSQFNEGGISQLDFDLNKYLMPILNEFANDIKIENYFRLTKESVILLKLKQGSAILLKGILNKALTTNDNELFDSSSSQTQDNENSKKFTIYNAKNSLKEFGIVQLSCEQARDILNLRSDFIEL